MPNPWTVSMDAEDFFYEIIARDDTAKLRALLDAIPEWERVAVERVKAAETEDMTGIPEHHREMRAQQVNDEFFMIHLTTQALYASVAVAISATVDHFVKALAKKEKRWFIPIQDSEEVPADRTVVPADDLPGYESANLARLLNNCYKHAGGKASNPVAKRCGFVRDEEIPYDRVDWATIIDDVRTFLLALVRRVFPRPTA